MIICVLLLGFSACSNEDDIHAKVEDGWYNLEDDPSDPVQHYIYQFYNCLLYTSLFGREVLSLLLGISFPVGNFCGEYYR